MFKQGDSSNKQKMKASQVTLTCSKSTIETLKKSVKYVQS